MASTWGDSWAEDIWGVSWEVSEDEDIPEFPFILLMKDYSDGIDD